MSKPKYKPESTQPDNTEIVDAELELSAARLWQYLQATKNVSIKDLFDNYAEILTQRLKELLPADAVAKLGIRLTLGRLQRQGKIKIFHDPYTNQDRISLATDWAFKSKWMTALEISPNML
ncbi:MAG: hypothetical protein AB1599_01690 [Planctomycetota bacterium]